VRWSWSLRGRPAARETRWAHLLSGAPAPAAPDSASPAARDDVPPEAIALAARLAQIEAEIDDLRRTIADLRSKLGESS
jgi:uncharacterized protein YceH (UPF0502 family)